MSKPRQQMRKTISHDRLIDLLSYDKRSGAFAWVKAPRCHSELLGKIAGHLRTNGYRYIQIDSRPYRASRLAWFFVKKKWPKSLIDHKGGFSP